MALTVYGLKNCDTCRKALKHLNEAAIDHRFVDIRTGGVTRDQISQWAAAAGWEILLNRRGTTWRGLADGQKADVDADKAISLMAEHPALIKRPVIVKESDVLVGFSDEVRTAI